MYVYHVLAVPTEARGNTDPLELKLQMAVVRHVGTENPPKAL